MQWSDQPMFGSMAARPAVRGRSQKQVRTSVCASQPGSGQAGGQSGSSGTDVDASRLKVWEAFDSCAAADRICSAGWRAFLGNPSVSCWHVPTH